MKAQILLILMGCWSLCWSQSPVNDDTVYTMVQSGHYIGSIDISADQKYALTTDKQTIALWNLERRRIIKMVTQPNMDARFHPLNASWIAVRPINDWNISNVSEATYYTYNIFTGQRLGIKKGKDLSDKQRRMENFLLDQKSGVVTIKSRKTGEVIGSLDGHMGLTTARIALSSNDSLLMQSGLRPLDMGLKKCQVSKNNSLYRIF